MDILIKNMKMPKACSWFDEEGKFHACRFDYACVCCITGNSVATSVERRHPSCPLVELPPHGRLADIDRMIADGRKGRKDVFPVCIESMDDLADFLETYAELDKTDHTIVLEAST